MYRPPEALRRPEPASFSYVRLAVTSMEDFSTPEHRKLLNSVLAGTTNLDTLGPELVDAFGPGEAKKIISAVIGLTNDKAEDRIARSARRWANRALASIDERGWRYPSGLYASRHDDPASNW